MRGIQRGVKALPFLAGAVVLLLGGCAQQRVPEVVDSPTLTIGEDGRITYYLVGEFDRDYYVVEELAELAAQEAAVFNRTVIPSASGEGQQAVTVEKVEALGDEKGTVVVTYLFDVWRNFNTFTEKELFYGTVAEAGEEGLEAAGMFQSVKGDTTLPAEAIKQEGERMLIVTDVKADIYCPGKVTHFSEGALLNQDGSVDTSRVEGLVYILMK